MTPDPDVDRAARLRKAKGRKDREGPDAPPVGNTRASGPNKRFPKCPFCLIDLDEPLSKHLPCGGV